MSPRRLLSLPVPALIISIVIVVLAHTPSAITSDSAGDRNVLTSRSIIEMVAAKLPVIWPKARLQRGEKVRILELDGPKPLTVFFAPVRYAELQESIAPQSLDYRLSLRTARTFTSLCPLDESACFSDLFRLVEDAT